MRSEETEGGEFNMDKRMWRVAGVTLAATAALAAVVGAAILFSGVVNISAAKPHFALTQWILTEGMDRSVERHSAGIVPPQSFTDEQVRHGFIHFDEMCVWCHGAPGVEPSESGKGLRPRPPDLVKAVPELKDTEIFWIVKNGIKFTGMPTYGPTHSDNEIWGIVGFVKTLPSLKSERYLELRRTLQTAEHSHDGSHQH
jgi:mono/diheme cytochrome c family protein